MTIHHHLSNIYPTSIQRSVIRQIQHLSHRLYEYGSVGTVRFDTARLPDTMLGRRRRRSTVDLGTVRVYTTARVHLGRRCDVHVVNLFCVSNLVQSERAAHEYTVAWTTTSTGQVRGVREQSSKAAEIPAGGGPDKQYEYR